jgi:hypothetical protein
MQTIQHGNNLMELFGRMSFSAIHLYPLPVSGFFFSELSNKLILTRCLQKGSVIEVDLAVICACLPASKSSMSFVGGKIWIITSRVAASLSTSAALQSAASACRSKPSATINADTIMPTGNSTTLSSEPVELGSKLQAGFGWLQLCDTKSTNVGADASYEQSGDLEGGLLMCLH